MDCAEVRAEREAHAKTRADLDAARAEAARLRDLIRELLVDQAYGHKTIIPTCMCRWCRARALAAPPPAAAPQPEPAAAQPAQERAAPEPAKAPDCEDVGLSGECMHVAGKRFWDKQPAPPPRPELTPEEVAADVRKLKDDLMEQARTALRAIDALRRLGIPSMTHPFFDEIVDGTAVKLGLLVPRASQPPPARGEKAEGGKP